MCHKFGYDNTVTSPNNSSNDADRSLTDTQQRRLLDVIHTRSTMHPIRDRCLMLVAFYTGATLDELHNLDIQDLYTGRRNEYLIFGNRQVPLHPDVRETAMMWDAVRGHSTTGTQRAMFVSWQGGRLARHRISDIISQYGQAANITDLTAHVLRLTFAARMESDGATPEYTQYVLGVSPRTLYRYLS